METVKETTTKPIQAKLKEENKEAKSASGSNDVKNRGWPKGKKRYPKSPGAPKQPLSGYVHFLNDRRESVRKETPEMSFADISKKLANEWSQLGQEEKQKYAERAEQDKERYSREFLEYQNSDQYKDYIAKQELERKHDNSGEVDAKKAKKSKKSSSSAMAISSESKISLDIPIFRDEFLELNKARETELRSLKKTVSEFEEQNAVLQKHVDNMKSAVSKLERDVALTSENNEALEKQLEAMKSQVLTQFMNIKVTPDIGKVTKDNVEEFVETLLKQVGKDPQLKEMVNRAAANIDLSLLL